MINMEFLIKLFPLQLQRNFIGNFIRNIMDLSVFSLHGGIKSLTNIYIVCGIFALSGMIPPISHYGSNSFSPCAPTKI